MRKLLLTSAGLENKSFQKLFLQHINKDADRIRVILVPTAATSDDSREMLPECFWDLTNAGILPENIFIYHLGYIMSHSYPTAYKVQQVSIPIQFKLPTANEMLEFDAIYFCGGSSSFLLSEINRTGFRDVLKKAVEKGLFYIGVSAGSIIAAGNYPDNLGYIKNRLSVHAETGTACGKLPSSEKISLTNSQAIWIEGDKCEIIG